MAAQLNHTIVWSSDQTKSALFLAEMLGRPTPTRFGHFDVVELDNGVSLDFANADGRVRPLHYGFLISEADFDAVLRRIDERGLDHWADPMRRDALTDRFKARPSQLGGRVLGDRVGNRHPEFFKRVQSLR